MYINVQKKLLVSGIPVFTLTFWNFFFGSTVAGILSVIWIKDFNPFQVSWKAWGALLYAGIPAGTGSFLFQTYSTQRLVPTVVVVYGTLMPFTNSILAYFILGTTIHYLIFTGAVLIIAGGGR